MEKKKTTTASMAVTGIDARELDMLCQLNKLLIERCRLLERYNRNLHQTLLLVKPPMSEGEATFMEAIGPPVKRKRN